MRFKCVHACQFLGGLKQKGDIVTAGDNELRRPEYARLNDPGSFVPIAEGVAGLPPTAEATAEEKALEGARLQMSGLGIQWRADMNQEELNALLVQALQPDTVKGNAGADADLKRWADAAPAEGVAGLPPIEEAAGLQRMVIVPGAEISKPGAEPDDEDVPLTRGEIDVMELDELQGRLTLAGIKFSAQAKEDNLRAKLWAAVEAAG